ncbi:hypothetical protein RchiOBHm_Chr3g0469671 [Rosa chinensis]|uniref:Transmembrane protein n=1 Tax=Rosa chinensis TaxID=74649 RepID=A0A2P6RAW7_ROSCH|nr:uncharacterized protein LOC112192923 [Rosa chinensis]PRQ43550.1 hypothetical protein RchiOBHm_Chr3g0469671 [Rosa chinensis]
MSSQKKKSPAAMESLRLNLFTVLGECVRILKAEYLYLFYLSFLYLFPKSFSSIAYPTRQNLLKAEHPFPNKFQSETLLALAFSSLSFIFSYSGFIHYSLGLWSITYAVYYGRPVKPISALFKSAFVSFLPLLGMVIISIPNMVTLFNLVHLGQNLFKVIRGSEESKLDILDIVILLGSVHLHLEWNLASSIVVIESRGLVESMRKSSSLMKGNKMLGLMMLLIFGTPALILGLFSDCILQVQLGLTGDLSHGGWWRMVTSEFVVQIVIVSVLFTLVLLFNTVSNIVLYLYCIKAERTTH